MNKGMGQVLASVMFVTLLAACGGVPVKQAPPPPEVGVVTVTPASVAETYEFTGQVQPFRRVEVRSRIDGIIEARPFTEGSQVEEGQVLYRLDGIRTEAGYQMALARADNARRTMARLEPLLRQNAVAQQDVDDARAELASAEAALADATKNRDDAVIRAEISGKVGRTLLDAGSRVSGSGDLLTTIDVLDPVYVSFRPSSGQLQSWRRDPATREMLQPGSSLEVKITLPDGTVYPRTGTLDFIAPSSDAATGTQEMRAKLDNPGLLLSPGQFVRVRLVGFVRDHAITVPQRAVQQSLDRQFVYVVSPGDTVTARDVEPGAWTGDDWIILNGLAAGDRVVVDGTQKAAPGQLVRPVTVTNTASAAGKPGEGS
ncbi:MAG: efflux RND transporter periplasmic adaptor subunit [Gemmatimonadales bacterium]